MPKDDATWLNVCYVALFFITAYVFSKAGDTLGVQTGWIERYDQWYPLASNLVSLVLGGISIWFIQRDPERKDYHLSAIGELRKVTWPSAIDTRRMTIIVVVVVGIFSAILWVFDTGFSSALKQILPRAS